MAAYSCGVVRTSAF